MPRSMKKVLVLAAAGLAATLVGWWLVAVDPGLGTALIYFGVWLLIAAAAAVGARIVQDDLSDDIRALRREVLAITDDGGAPAAPQGPPVGPASAVASHLETAPGSSLEDIITGTGLSRTEVRLGLADLNAAGLLDDAGTGYRLT